MNKPLDSVCVHHCPTYDYNKLLNKVSGEKLGFDDFRTLRNLFFEKMNLDTSSKLFYFVFVL